MREVDEQLSARLGAPIEPELCHRVDFASRVLWPPELDGHPLFDFEAVRSGPRLWHRIMDWFAPRVSERFTAEVAEHLDLHAPE